MHGAKTNDLLSLFHYKTTYPLNESYFFGTCAGLGLGGTGTKFAIYVRDANIDLICLRETIKTSFSNNELSSIGHSGGILIDAKLDVFDFIAFDQGVFFASMVVLHKALNKLWEVIVVYGPVDHSLSQIFLDELSIKLTSCSLPFVIGGDFNLLCSPNDKNNDNFSWSRANAFHQFFCSSIKLIMCVLFLTVSSFVMHGILSSPVRLSWLMLI